MAVARALANRPTLVLADEPTGALDDEDAQQVLDLIRKLCAEVNAALLLVTHDLGIAKQLPRVLTLSELNEAPSSAMTRRGHGSVVASWHGRLARVYLNQQNSKTRASRPCHARITP